MSQNTVENTVSNKFANMTLSQALALPKEERKAFMSYVEEKDKAEAAAEAAAKSEKATQLKALKELEKKEESAIWLDKASKIVVNYRLYNDSLPLTKSGKKGSLWLQVNDKMIKENPQAAKLQALAVEFLKSLYSI